MTYAIESEGVGKRYRLQSAKAAQGSLVDAFAGMFKRGNGPGNEAFWAVQDVSFKVEHGEAIGLIGRNGAGKSTLLKIFSRVTDPSAGRFTLRGRVASLLEVGTGFHMELSGRENIYLNGAILGMRRAEITQRFDQIVDYAGVEKFLDLALKHYSSGMYLRLAFSVAAFLESEILIVDEVLAVGDAAFQEKCLGTMRDAARSGRTVLFVSHNMAAIAGLTKRCVLLDAGRIAFDGTTPDAVRHYLGIKERDDISGRQPVADIQYNLRLRWSDHVVISEMGLAPDQPDTINSGGSVRLQFLMEARSEVGGLRLAYTINSRQGTPLLSGLTPPFTIAQGRSLYELEIDALKLVPGDYDFSINLGYGGWCDTKTNFDNFMGFGRLTVTEALPDGRLFGQWDAHWGAVTHHECRWTSLPL